MPTATNNTSQRLRLKNAQPSATARPAKIPAATELNRSSPNRATLTRTELSDLPSHAIIATSSTSNNKMAIMLFKATRVLA